jgi:hypothetical protein
VAFLHAAVDTLHIVQNRSRAGCDRNNGSFYSRELETTHLVSNTASLGVDVQLWLSHPGSPSTDVLL